MNMFTKYIGVLFVMLGVTGVWAAEVPESAADVEPIGVGEVVPDMTLRDASGDTHELRALVSEQPTVLIFYRGGWCPYCTEHLSGLVDIEEELTTLGYQLLAISPDRPSVLAEAEAASDELDVPTSYRLLSDSDMTVARAFGLAFQVDADTLAQYREYGIDLEEASGADHHWLPVPAVYLVGTDGTIVFSYANPDYTQRLAPEAIVAAAGEHVDAAQDGVFVRLLDWIDSIGPVGMAIFVLFYIVSTVLFIPGSALTLGAGAIFGLLWGTILVSVGSTLGATAAFVVGRYLARDWVAKKIERNAKFTAIDRAVGREGWKIVLLTRLSPVFPFSLLNYAYGLTKVTLPHYFFASWLGMLPGTVMYVYLGSLARLGVQVQETTTAEVVLRVVGLVATVLVTVYITKIARKALKERVE